MGSSSMYASKPWERITNIHLLGWTVPEIHALNIQERWWWRWWLSSSHSKSTQEPFDFAMYHRETKWKHSTIMFFLVCVFAAFALTWQLPKSILTCKQTWELTASTWKTKEFQETILDFLSATRQQEVQELSVPQLSCQKNLAMPCSNEGSWLPQLRHLLTLSRTDAFCHFWNEKLKRGGIPKPWMNTDKATCNDRTLRWYMELRDLSGGERFSPHHHICRLWLISDVTSAEKLVLDYSLLDKTQLCTKHMLHSKNLTILNVIETRIKTHL